MCACALPLYSVMAQRDWEMGSLRSDEPCEKLPCRPSSWLTPSAPALTSWRPPSWSMGLWCALLLADRADLSNYNLLRPEYSCQAGRFPVPQLRRPGARHPGARPYGEHAVGLQSTTVVMLDPGGMGARCVRSKVSRPSLSVSRPMNGVMRREELPLVVVGLARPLWRRWRTAVWLVHCCWD